MSFVFTQPYGADRSVLDPRRLTMWPFKRSTRPAVHNRCRATVAVELLEDRCLPSTLTVTSDADDNGKGTLRSAVGAAKGGDVIQFNLKAGATIKLTAGEIVISKNITIKGPGADN